MALPFNDDHDDRGFIEPRGLQVRCSSSTCAAQHESDTRSHSKFGDRLRELGWGYIYGVGWHCQPCHTKRK